MAWRLVFIRWKYRKTVGIYRRVTRSEFTDVPTFYIYVYFVNQMTAFVGDTHQVSVAHSALTYMHALIYFPSCSRTYLSTLSTRTRNLLCLA